MKPSEYRDTAATRPVRAVAACALLMEIIRYVIGSPCSRMRQLEALRELDDRLRDDVGISYKEAHTARAFEFYQKPQSVNATKYQVVSGSR